MTYKTGVELICATTLEPEPIQWIWRDWLAAGKFHILAGAPGTGKTTIALSLAAIITLGTQWPDGSQSLPGNVLIWSGEDDPKDTLLPRLLAHYADRRRIYFVSDVLENNKPRSFDPSRDLSKLHDKASEIGNVRLIIIDPVVNVVSGDSHKNGEVRRDLRPLINLGEKLKAAIIGITHFNKGTIVRDPLERVTGSIAFGALARVVLATAKITEPSGHQKRVFVRAKSNNGPDGDGYQYRIEQIELPNYEGVFSSKVIWEQQVQGSAQELLNNENDQFYSEDRSALSDAINFLKILLSEGPLSKKEIDDQSKEAGIKNITLRRAKSILGIETIHEGYGKGSTWKWYLPSSKMIKNHEHAHENNVEHHCKKMSNFD